MKKLFLILILTVVVAVSAAAQEVSVKNFNMDPMDLTAQKHFRKDLHGEKCAVLKVHVIADGVTFQGNLIGEPVEKPGEYWVYLTEGTKQVQILSRSFLPYMHYFDEPLQGGATYILTLQAPQSFGTTPKKPAENYFVLRVTPANANVFIDSNPQAVEDGAVTIPLADGTHSYRVEAVGFATQQGTVIMAGKRESRTVTLRSTKPTLTVTAATPATEIFINDSRKGAGRWSGELLPGTYMVEGRLTSHRTHTQKVTLTEGNNQTLAIPALTAITGSLNVNYKPIDATITIDGRAAGVTPNIITDLLVGTHSVTISKDGYTPATLSANVSESSPTTLSGTLSPQAVFTDPEITSYSSVNDPYADDIAITEEYECFEKSGKYGYKRNGKVVIPAKFDFAHSYFSEGLAAAGLDGKYGYIDKNGKMVIHTGGYAGGPFSEGLAAVTIDGKEGYINKTGTLVIPANYDNASFFSEGLAAVQINDKYGYINKAGTLVIPAKYEEASYFSSEGSAKVKLYGREFYIDRNGKEVK